MGCTWCRGRQEIQADGSVLDRVISQASNEDQCLLYRLANYKKGGELIDAYNMGGQAEVEKLIREQFGVLMYCEGRGQVINRAEYLRWKFRDLRHVVLPIEASLSRYDPLSRWHDHAACWQMRHRGALGESLLHVLIMCDTRAHTRLARTLLKCFPRLALDVVEGEEYLGASSLHLAIAYSNNELVQDLIEAGADVNQRAIGSFFLPRDQQRPHPARHTDYEGLAYLGEYPLAWAACCANESVYNLLLDSGADPDLQDTFGNMILHMVVVCDKLDMFGYALRHPKLPASNGKVNQEGLTPLTLACKLGRAEVFREMLELSAREFWRYSNITCSAYPLNALDTLLPDGRTNWNSALFIILNGTKEAHLDMLDGGIIQRLLEEKWKTFARNQFLKRLLILFIHLVFLSLAVYLRPEEQTAPLLGAPEDFKDAARYVCELGTLLGVLSYVLLQQGDEVKNQGLGAFLKQLTHAPAKAIFLVSNLLILACIPCRLMGDKSSEEAILVFAVPGSWFLLMFFAGAVRLTGPFVTMIYSMITGDMLTFGIIYTIVLFGFSQSFFFLYKGFPGVKNSLFNSYPSTWMALFQITMGDYSYADLSFTTYPNLSKSVFALFMVFVPILLLNMLIAMMGNTYAHVIEQSEKEWMKQWAKIVVTLERAVAQSDAHHYLQEYSIGLGPSDDPRYEQRGVMVIKSKSKTRAKQRKGAVTNWKRVGKVTINELRKRNMTGEDLRRIMWGRASISTPTKIPIKPPMDMTMQANGPNIAGGFGEALSSALDVMSFTHDLEIVGANGLALQSTAMRAPPPAPTVPVAPGVGAMGGAAGQAAKGGGFLNQTKPAVDTGGSLMGMLSQISDSTVPANTGLQMKAGSTMMTSGKQPTTAQLNQKNLMQGAPNPAVITPGMYNPNASAALSGQLITGALSTPTGSVASGVCMNAATLAVHSGVSNVSSPVQNMQGVYTSNQMNLAQTAQVSNVISSAGTVQTQIMAGCYVSGSQTQMVGGMQQGQMIAGMQQGQMMAGMRQGQMIGGVQQQGQMVAGMQHGQMIAGMQQGQMIAGMQQGQMIAGMQQGQMIAGMQQGQMVAGMQQGQMIAGMQQGPMVSGMQQGQMISGMQQTQMLGGIPHQGQIAGMHQGTMIGGMQQGQMLGGMPQQGQMIPGFPQQMAMKPPIIIYSDPLREIVHLSDSKDSPEHQDRIRSLAIEAANLYHVEEIIPVAKPKSRTAVGGVSMAGCLTNLFGVEAPTGPAVDWAAGEKRRKKLSAMEVSDSDGLGEAPLLGRSARTKRARSATKRNLETQKLKPGADGRKPGSARRGGLLTAIADSASSTDVPPSTHEDELKPEEGAGDGEGPDGLDYASERIQQIQDSIMNTRRSSADNGEKEVDLPRGLSLKDMRPLNIEQAVKGAGGGAGGQPHHTPMDTIQEKAVVFKGEGSGQEVESGCNSHGVRFHGDAKFTKDRRKADKRKTRQRPKTARTNRVAPMVDGEDEQSVRRRRGHSAHHSKKQQAAVAELEEPPDPLENWATAGLASMNTILSWDNDSDGY